MPKNKQPKGTIAKEQFDDFIASLDSQVKARDERRRRIYSDHSCRDCASYRVAVRGPDYYHGWPMPDIHLCRTRADKIPEELIPFGCIAFESVYTLGLKQDPNLLVIEAPADCPLGQLAHDQKDSPPDDPNVQVIEPIDGPTLQKAIETTHPFSETKRSDSDAE